MKIRVFLKFVFFLTFHLLQNVCDNIIRLAYLKTGNDIRKFTFFMMQIKDVEL